MDLLSSGFEGLTSTTPLLPLQEKDKEDLGMP